MQTRSPIEHLLGPDWTRRFIEDYWTRRPLRRSGPPERFQAIYDLDAWYSGAGFEEVFAVIDEDGVPASRSVSVQEMYALYASGVTVCADVSEYPTVMPFLASLTSAIGEPSDSSFAKFYGSGTDGSGFPLHWDQHSVFILQLDGVKRWQYESTPGILNPISSGGMDSSGTPKFARAGVRETPRGHDGEPARVPNSDGLQHAILERGDCLYLPPGTWHHGQAVGHSFGLSLSPVCV